MAYILGRLISWNIKFEKVDSKCVRVYGNFDGFSVVRESEQENYIEVDGRLIDYEDFEVGYMLLSNEMRIYLERKLEIMTNYESIKNMSIEDMAKMNVKAFMYMNGYRTNVEYYTTNQSIFDTREEAEEYELKWLQSNEDRETLDTITFKNRIKR